MTSKESILNHEIIFATSDKTVSKMITVLKKEKRIVKIAAKIYTSNLNDKPENIIRRNLFVILGTLYPDAVLSYRSAFECRPSVDGHLYLTYGYAKKVSLPGVTVHLIEGAGAMEGDYPFMGGLYIAGGARAFLENFSQKYSKDGVSKSLPQNVLEEKLEKIIQSGGEEDVGTSRYKPRNIQDQKQQGWRNVFCGFSTGERHVEKRLRNVPQSQQSFCKSDFYAVYDKRSASIFGRQRTYFAHMMNAELTAANQSKIIIPTVFRSDYLASLRQLTRRDNPEKIINAMLRVRQFSSLIAGESFQEVKAFLTRCNAFETDDDSILQF